MKTEEKISQLGIVLPEVSTPKAMYIQTKQIGNALFISGQVPTVDGRMLYPGHVGDEVSLEQAQEASRICVLNMLAAVKAYTGDLDRVNGVVKLQAFVSSKTGFTQQHIVVNAASELLVEIFGQKGFHTRTAIGTNQLPLNAPLEIEAIFEIA